MEKGKTIHISISSLVGSLEILPNENGKLPTKKQTIDIKRSFEKMKESLKSVEV